VQIEDRVQADKHPYITEFYTGNVRVVPVLLIQVLVILSAVLQLSLTGLDVCACAVNKLKWQLRQSIHMRAGLT
jgi:hypothetical protein